MTLKQWLKKKHTVHFFNGVNKTLYRESFLVSWWKVLLCILFLSVWPFAQIYSETFISFLFKYVNEILVHRCFLHVVLHPLGGTVSSIMYCRGFSQLISFPLALVVKYMKSPQDLLNQKSRYLNSVSERTRSLMIAIHIFKLQQKVCMQVSRPVIG